MKHFYTLFVICLAFSSWINDATARTVNIPDANLASAVREALDLGPNAPITQRAMQQLTTLEGIEDPITDLTGLEHATQLEVLSLSYSHHNPISDLTPLKQLTLLETFSVACSDISDLTPLKNLQNLKSLNIICTDTLSDLTPLKNLKNLWSLNLCGTSISDLAPLKNLTNLQWLEIRNNQITDISSLTGLTRLETLDFQGNQVSDVTPLIRLKSLESIKLAGNPITTPLHRLQDLPILDILLDGTGVEWITDNALEGMIRGILNLGKGEPLTQQAMETLSFLGANRLKVTDITGLEYATQLEVLSLSANQISDLTPLRDLPN